MLNLSAAFDTVDHEILLRRLRTTFNINDSVLQWLKSYLTGRSVRVCVDGVYLDAITLDCSLPQGSQMGPKKYSDYVMPLGRLLRLQQIVYHYYVDNAQVSKSFNPKDVDSQLTAIRGLESGIGDISRWMFANRLKLDPDKTEFIVFVSKQNLKHIRIHQLNVDGDAIPTVPVVRNLGIYLDSHLCFDQHIVYLRKVYFMFISWIRKIRHLLTFDATKILVHALIISRLDYCNSLFTGLPRCNR